MSLRMPTFVCAAGHVFETVIDASVTVTHCQCGTVAVKRAVQGAPSVRSCERVSRDEVRQAQAQFGFAPKNRDELNVLLKEKGMTTVSTREFESAAFRDRPEPPPPSREETEGMIQRIKTRREQFRSAYDSGAIQKVEAPADIQQAAREEIREVVK